MDVTMVEYCPKCNAQLPPGLEKCPNCGHRLHSKRKDEYTLKDIVLISATILGILIIPLLIIIGIVWLLIYH
jgi:ribosomal protein L40E